MGRFYSGAHFMRRDEPEGPLAFPAFVHKVAARLPLPTATWMPIAPFPESRQGRTIRVRLKFVR
jgi:hypothetical protein